MKSGTEKNTETSRPGVCWRAPAGSRGRAPARGGYSSMIWVGTCRWDLKSRPIFIPNFAEKWDPFLYQSHKFEAKLSKNFTFISKIVRLLSKFQKFWDQIDGIGPIFTPILEILKIWPMFIPVFALNKESSLYQEADFETHFSGTSLDRPLY